MNEKILIVDDDLDSLKLIGLMLQRRGYQIVAAQGGAQAMDKAEIEKPDLIILDVMMPGMDGLEVCRQLRARPTTAPIPIIMFTAKTTVGDKVAGFNAGADDYLTKPMHPAELASRVEAVLLRSRHARPSLAAAPTTQGQIIGFLGCKGGVGTSTLALNVAVALNQDKRAGQSRRVVLAELMTGAGAISLHLGLVYKIGISNLLNMAMEEVTDRAIESQLTTHTTGVKMLLAPPWPRTSNLPAAHAQTIVRYLAAQNDIVVLDLGCGLDDGVRATLLVSHYIVIVIESQRVALAQAQALLQELDKAGIPRGNMGLALVNRVPSAANLTRSMIEDMLKATFLSIVPPAPELAFQAIESGIPLIMVQPNSLISNQIQELARQIPLQ